MRLIVCALALTAVCAAGCGGGNNSQPSSSTPNAGATPAPSSGGGSTIAIAADPSGALKFDKTTLTAKAGKVTIDFDNPSGVPHAFEVAGKSTDTVTQGKAPPLTVTLKPGTYQFICPVDGHAAAGMKGTLTVK
jgi:uncharacterized cupredoxin-like copper-binding protein